MAFENFPLGELMQYPLQKRRQQNENFNQAANFGGELGGGIGEIIANYKKDQILKQLLQAMNQQGAPQQGPPLAPQGTPQPNLSQIPPGQPMSAGGSNIGQDVQMPQPVPTQGPGQPTSGMGAPPQDNSKQIQALMMQYDPQSAIKQMMQKQQQKPTSPWRVVPGMISPAGKPLQQNEQTGEVREVDLGAIPTGRGNAALQNMLASQGGGKVTLKSPTDQAKSHFYESRATGAEVGALSQIEKNIDPSVATRTTPVGAAASSIRRAINGLSLLQQPVVTKTALEATTADIDSILTQAGATVEGRKMLSTPNFLQKLTNYKSFVSAAPDKVSVPPGMVNIYKDILNDLAPIQEKFIKDRVKQQGEFYRSRAEGLVGKKQYDDMLNRVISGFSLQVPGSTQGAFSDPGKEARYQAWKKNQGL